MMPLQERLCAVFQKLISIPVRENDSEMGEDVGFRDFLLSYQIIQFDYYSKRGLQPPAGCENPGR